MTDPTRTSSANAQSDVDSRELLDTTRPRAGPAWGEPNFAPPERRGEVGQLGRYRVLKKLGQGGMGPSTSATTARWTARSR